MRTPWNNLPKVFSREEKVVAFLGAFSLSAFLLFLFSLCSSGLPSDEDLLRRFESDQSNLLELLEMSNEDAEVVRIAPSFTRIENNWSWPRPLSELGFSEERWTSYKELFAKCGLADEMERTNSSVWFYVASVGLGNGHGSSKGFAYLPNAGQYLVTDLDTDTVDRDRHQTVVRRIRGNWFIYRD